MISSNLFNQPCSYLNFRSVIISRTSMTETQFSSPSSHIQSLLQQSVKVKSRRGDDEETHTLIILYSPSQIVINFPWNTTFNPVIACSRENVFIIIPVFSFLFGLGSKVDVTRHHIDLTNTLCPFVFIDNFYSIELKRCHGRSGWTKVLD